MCTPILPPFVRRTLVRVRQTGGGSARCQNRRAFLLLFQNSGQEHHLFLLGHPEATVNVSGDLSQNVRTWLLRNCISKAFRNDFAITTNQFVIKLYSSKRMLQWNMFVILTSCSPRCRDRSSSCTPRPLPCTAGSRFQNHNRYLWRAADTGSSACPLRGTTPDTSTRVNVYF